MWLTRETSKEQYVTAARSQCRVAAFPKWPLLFLAAIPFFFIHGCDDCDTPPPTTTPPPPDARDSRACLAAVVWFRTGCLRSQLASALCPRKTGGADSDYGGGLIKMLKAILTKTITAKSPCRSAGAHILHGPSCFQGPGEEAKAGEVWNDQNSNHSRWTTAGNRWQT